MVVQKTLDNLKDKSHEEKKVVASGVAIFVVVALLVGWGFLFLRKIQKGTMPTLEGSLVPADQFDTNFLKETQEQINTIYRDSNDQLQEVRQNAAGNDASVQTQTYESVPASGSGDQFGTQ